MTKDSPLDTHIAHLVRTHPIREQSQLQAFLKEYGHPIPQATLSRRLKKLKIAKVGGIYKGLGFNFSPTPPILRMQSSDSNLIVLHTYPGHASNLAYFIDQKYITFSPQQAQNNGILGTIAGDDTVLIIVKSKVYLSPIMEAFSQDFPSP